MKLDKIPTSIDPNMNLEQIREECRKLVKKRAFISAGAAVIPVPFLDVAIDASILSVLLPEISAKFGLAPEQMAVFDMETKEIQWDELRKRGVQFVGLVVTRGAVKKSIQGLGTKIVTKQVTKFIPLGGQIIAASLGFYVMRKVANAHVDDSYNLAKELQRKQHSNLVSA
jgi:uncharacterized protein (DUF697 family)